MTQITSGAPHGTKSKAPKLNPATVPSSSTTLMGPAVHAKEASRRQGGRHPHASLKSKKADGVVYTSKDAAGDASRGACITAWPADEPYCDPEENPVSWEATDAASIEPRSCLFSAATEAM